MAAQSLLAKLGMRLGTLGASGSLAFAFPLATDNPSMAAHTDAARIGMYADRTGGAEKVGHVVMGAEVLSVGVNDITAAVRMNTAASTALGGAGFNIAPGVAPSTPSDGDVWVTASGMFVRAGGTTIGPFAAASSGTVTSVGLSLPAIFSVSGSPVTTSGTLTGTLADQTANTIFAGPAAGGATTPTFRALVAADLPAGTGTVTSVSVTTANGVSGSVATATTTPAITLTLGAITPSSVAATGLVTGSNLISGTGSPENVVTAPVGTIFERTDGGSGTTLYVKESGAGSTGWTAIAGGAGTVGGLIGVNQVAFGAGANAVQGNNALQFTTTNGLVVNLANAGGADNLTIGSTAGNSLTTGARNTLLGTNAGTALTTVNDVVAVGYNALAACTVADNTAVGAGAADAITTSLRVTAVGRDALGAGVAGASDCTAIGYNALAACTAVENTAVGSGAADAVTTATGIVAIGFGALGGATTGNSSSVAVGYQALLVASSGAGNTAVGYQAGVSITTGTANTMVGALANPSAGVNNSVMIGYGSTCSSSSSIALGTDATVTAANTMVVGSNTAAINDVYIGKGIINASPATTTINATGGSGSNIAGAALQLAGGRGTGTGVGGAINFLTAKAGTAGSSLNALTTCVSVLQDGAFDWTGIATASAPAVSAAAHGTMYFDSTTNTFKVSLNGGAYVNIVTGTGGGTIGGTIATSQVAYGSGVDTIAGSAKFTFSATTGLNVNMASSGADNLNLGSGSGDSLTSGARNTTVGSGAGTAYTTTNDAVAVGYNALNSSTAAENTAVGSGAASAATSSGRLVAVGFNALSSGTTGVADSTAVGYKALTLCTGSNNTAVGSNAMAASGAGGACVQNVAVGYNALNACDSGTNTAVGSRAAELLTSGERITAMGFLALSAGTTGVDDCTALGYTALAACTVAQNTAVGGRAADALTTSLRVVAVGYNALGAGTTGVSDCTAVGHSALLLATGTRNTAVGSLAGDAITSGASNTAIGYGALTAISTNSGCTAVGDTALGVATGGSNTAVGYFAGLTVTTGTNNVIIGYTADAATGVGTLGGSIVIGSGAIGTANNQFVAGSSTYPATDVYFGKGVTNVSPTGYTINGTGGSGTNVAGADLTIAGGKGTGNAAGGSVLISTSVPGASGTTLASLVTRGAFDIGAGAGTTGFRLWDVDNNTLERVTVGAADSGGTGFKLLRIPN